MAQLFNLKRVGSMQESLLSEAGDASLSPASLSGAITVRDVLKKFPGKHSVNALENVSLTIREREFVSILGPSGCGKSTLLRIVAGLVPYNSGAVLVNS